MAALELLLRLTRINDEGRHTRQRVALEEAVFVAGNGDDKTGRKVVGMLSGQRDHAVMYTGHHDVLRLITINQEQDRHYADLIHETLIRARTKIPQRENWLVIGRRYSITSTITAIATNTVSY